MMLFIRVAIELFKMPQNGESHSIETLEMKIW